MEINIDQGVAYTYIHIYIYIHINIKSNMKYHHRYTITDITSQVERS